MIHDYEGSHWQSRVSSGSQAAQHGVAWSFFCLFPHGSDISRHETTRPPSSCLRSDDVCYVFGGQLFSGTGESHLKPRSNAPSHWLESEIVAHPYGSIQCSSPRTLRSTQHRRRWWYAYLLDRACSRH